MDKPTAGYPVYGKPDSSDKTYYVRFVRANLQYGLNSFIDNGDNTISDTATGLTWMKLDSGHPLLSINMENYTRDDGSLNWKEALDFAENLTYAGFSDWRLPDAKELHSIVDYERSPDTTNSPAINPIFDTTSILDGSNQLDYPYFWTGTTHLDGPVTGEYGIYISFGEAEGYFSAP